MSDTYSSNPLVDLSEAMADAVAQAGAATVMVDARQRMPASGIAYAPDLVLTANHVLERDEDIYIGLADGERLPASLAGRDPGSDLALLRVNSKGLSPALPASKPARIGQLVLALGRPSMDGLQASLGVIGAIGGPVRIGHGGLLESYLRTDTTPYPGFSGGPLIDTAGNILGINTSGLAHGMSLTIPVEIAWHIADNLAEYGLVRRGYLGIRSQPVALQVAQRVSLGREQMNGLLLVGIEESGPADHSGLMVGDILVGVAGLPVNDPDELVAHLTGDLVGQSVLVEVLRGGQPLGLTVVIGSRS